MIQRVTGAEVTWTPDPGREPERRSVGPGLVVLVGSGPSDSEEVARRLAEKVAGLRILADWQGRTNLALAEVGGEALVVSQFTLYANLSRGRRPSFIGAGDPIAAERLYRVFATALAEQGVRVQTGSFGAAMAVTLTNDGPFTIVLSSDDWPTRV